MGIQWLLQTTFVGSMVVLNINNGGTMTIEITHYIVNDL